MLKISNFLWKARYFLLSVNYFFCWHFIKSSPSNGVNFLLRGIIVVIYQRMAYLCARY
jgi:hypothetical protein